jgi:nicotinamidase-related amidase
MKALLIIDMQNGGFTEGLFRYEAASVIDNINRLAELMRSSGYKVIFIQHDGTKENAFVPGTSEWEIIPALQRHETDICISKTANDAFYNSALKNILDELGIKELLVAGWATDYCVDSTIRAALSHDYDVTVISDAHTCGNRPHLGAAHIVAHHNYTWQNMIATNGTVNVLPYWRIAEAYSMQGLSV